MTCRTHDVLRRGKAQTLIWLAMGCLIAGCSPPSFPAESPRDSSFVDQGEGRALVNDLLTRMPPENTEVLGLLKIRAPDGPITEVPIKMKVRVSADGWEDVYETQPFADRAGEVLVIRHHGLQPSQYFYGKFRNDQEKAAPATIDREKLFQPLAGSDFFLADLGLEFLHWPEQKIVKKEMRKSRSCRVVESTNPEQTDYGYARVRSWIDLETGNLIMAEAFDSKNRLLKEFSIRKISRSEGKAQLKEIEMRNNQTESRTRLEFNFDVPDSADRR